MIFLRRTILAITILLLALSIGIMVSAQSPKIDVLTVKGTVNPVLVGYIQRGIEEAEDTGAEAVIIRWIRREDWTIPREK